jgi:hypothetical protein
MPGDHSRARDVGGRATYQKALRRVWGQEAPEADEYEIAARKFEQGQNGRGEHSHRVLRLKAGAIAPGRPGPVLGGDALALIEMSTLLTPNQKRVWRRIQELDRPVGMKPGGCFAKPSTLAIRLAISPDHVTRCMKALRQLGLITREGAKGRWFPLLPASIPPTADTPAGKARDAWYKQWAVRLDTFLAAAKWPIASDEKSGRKG